MTQKCDHEGVCPVCGECSVCCTCAEGEPRCEGCGHTEGEGCGCPPKPDEAPLTLESMGLLGFMEGEGLRCPKCHMAGIKIDYHEMAVFTTDSADPAPCQQWIMKGLIQGSVGEHLCCVCQRCRYGFPMKCADA